MIRIPRTALPMACCMIVALLATGCASTPMPATERCVVDRQVVHEQLAGTLWVQTSAEYALGARQTYVAAAQAIDLALANTTHTALLEQTAPFSHKPPAVILDIDETVLDNSPFQAQLILDGTTYTPAAWARWVDRASADWVPGARAFIEKARDQGVSVFFVTNRKAAEETSTRRNFARLGAALPDAPDYVLSRNERPAWTGNKSSRRAEIARDYRVLVVVGDDLNDFVSARVGLDEREDIARRHAARFGTSWFVLPNPLYGSWERALHDASNPCDVIEQQRAALRGVAAND